MSNEQPVDNGVDNEKLPVDNKPGELIPETDEEETAPEPQPAQPKVLRDPTTGEPLRNQDPGVPDSKWVGDHNIHDVDGGEAKLPEQPTDRPLDLEEDEDEE